MMTPRFARFSGASPARARGWAMLAFVLIALASVWRLVGLDHLLVWHDEAFTLVRVLGYDQAEVERALFSGHALTPAQALRFQRTDSGHGWHGHWRALREHPEHAPLYYLLSRVVWSWRSDPVRAARATAALPAVLLAPLAFWLMRELHGRGAAPWVAALLVACSPLHVLYAQEARQYALWCVLTLASTAALLRARRRRRRVDWLLYAGSATLGLYTHLLFAPLLLLHGVSMGLSSGGVARWSALRAWSLAVGAAGVCFSPWLAVLALHAERVVVYTSWMARPVGTEAMFASWGAHLTRAFVDLDPAPPTWTLALLVPLAGAVGYYARRAPRPEVWFLTLLALLYVGLTLGPDLALGGSRSLHARYALPALLALQLMVAWTLATALTHPAWRRPAAIALTALLAGGVLSCAAIARAETWWTKGFSAVNAEVARLVNAAPQPLVVASPSGVAAGELLSLAHRLEPTVTLWGEPPGGATPPVGFATWFGLTPSPTLARATRSWRPVAESWQWFRAD